MSWLRGWEDVESGVAGLSVTVVAPRVVPPGCVPKGTRPLQRPEVTSPLSGRGAPQLHLLLGGAETGTQTVLVNNSCPVRFRVLFECSW